MKTGNEEYLPKRSVYRVPEGFFEEEIGRVTEAAMRGAAARTEAPAKRPLRRIMLWTAGVAAAAAMLAVLVVPGLLQSPDATLQPTSSGDMLTFSEEEADMARPELIAENDVFLSLY